SQTAEMDLLHSWGVNLAVYLQMEYQDSENLFHLRRDVGVNLIWVAVVGDWLNLWWVHETKFYGPIKRPELQQLSITCETGPGILQYSLQYLFQAYLFACSFILVTSLYSLDSASLLHARSGALVAVGLLLPVIIVAEIFSRVQWIYSAGLRKNISVTVFLLFFAVGFYVLLKAVGVDLLWTLAKAQKWCLNPDWVLLDTTPFASLLRNMGTLFGLGLGLHLSGYSETAGRKHSSVSFRIGCIGVSLLLFYSLSFCKSAVALVLPTALIPGVIYWMFIKKQS
uniref:Glucose-6-phosphatase a, catalytic subunit, tandem duplicate 1 n=1 Tax=Cyprinus carpio TaxID=7962 RepID=A0A8C2D9X7_CYPCA